MVKKGRREPSLQEFRRLIGDAVFESGLQAHYNFYREQVRNSSEYPGSTGPSLPEPFRLERTDDGQFIFGVRVFPESNQVEPKSFGYDWNGKRTVPVSPEILRENPGLGAYSHVEVIDYGAEPGIPISLGGNPVLDISCSVPAAKYKAGLRAFKEACQYAVKNASFW